MPSSVKSRPPCSKWWWVPNTITLIGACLVLYGVYLYESGSANAGIVCGAVGCWCDFFDGIAARVLKAESSFGNVLDKAVDKITNLSILIVTCTRFQVPYTFLFLFIAREVIMLHLRSSGRKAAGSTVLAKLKTFLFPYYFLLFHNGMDSFGYVYLTAMTLLNWITLL